MSRLPVAAGEPGSWLLELGAAARADEERPVLRKGHFGPWSSRRARARVRRAMIRDLLGGADKVEVEVEPESIDDTLVDRLSSYTRSGQPAATGSLLFTATGPGSACATTQTANR